MQQYPHLDTWILEIRIKNLTEMVGDKIKAACDEIISKKDQEFRQISITMRQEMDEKMRIEMNSLKTTLEMQNNAQKDKAIELYQVEKDHEIRILKKSWKDEQERLNKELKVQQRKVDNLPRKIEAATRALKIQCDEQKRQLTKAAQSSQNLMESWKHSQDCIERLEVENRNLMESWKHNQDCIERLQVENQNLMESWKNVEGRILNPSSEVQNEKDSRICIICMDKEISHAFLPCGHTICCKNCSKNVQNCPNCRANVHSSVMLYF